VSSVVFGIQFCGFIGIQSSALYYRLFQLVAGLLGSLQFIAHSSTFTVAMLATLGGYLYASHSDAQSIYDVGITAFSALGWIL